MGEMSELYDWGDPSMWESLAQEYFDSMDQDDLIKATSFVRSEKLKSIRQHGLSGRKLSDKQRWCLCFALEKHEKWGDR